MRNLIVAILFALALGASAQRPVGPGTGGGGGGGSGTVNTGTTNQLAYYAGNGTAVSGTTAIPNGTTATTQAANDNSTKVATTAYVDGKTSGNYVNLCSSVTLTNATCTSGVIVITNASASATISAIPGTYVNLVFSFNGNTTGGSSTTDLNMQFNSDSTAGHYGWSEQFSSASTANADTGGASATTARIGGFQGSTFVSSSTLSINGYTQPIQKIFQWAGAFTQSSNVVVQKSGTAFWTGTAAITSITIFPTSGTFATSYVTLYGTN